MDKEKFSELLESVREAAEINKAVKARDAEIATLRARLALVEPALVFVWMAFQVGVVDGCDLDGGMIQEELEKLGFIESRTVEPGSPEEDEWGEGAVLYYPKPEFLLAAAQPGEEVKHE